MKYLAILVTISIAACSSDPEPVEPALYDYSAENYHVPFEEAAALINEAAGCTLVGETEHAEYVNPIVVQDSHASGPSVVGCAWMGEALQRKEHPRDIILVEFILHEDESVLTTTHEIGHTLGLPHVAQHGIMYPVVSDNLTWDDASKARLQALCDTEDGYQALRVDELVIDRK